MMSSALDSEPAQRPPARQPR